MLTIRLAKIEEAKLCYQCIEDARAYHKSLGFEQWHIDYPTLNTIQEDIQDKIGYVFCVDDSIIGYCAIKKGGEPCYLKIDGAWKSDLPYLVVHRMAFLSSARGKGLSHEAFVSIKEFALKENIHAIRIDTQKENQVMQHILTREGFLYCGTVFFDGSAKLAFEWDESSSNQ